MPSVSKQQQKFFGVVKAMQKGDIPKKGSAGKAAKTMDKDDVDDFASTKHKGLPKKVKKEMKVRELIRKLVRELMTEESKAVDKVLDMADGGFGKLGGKTVDGLSANLFKAVYNKANDSNKAKIDKMNEKQLYNFMVNIWNKFGNQVKI